VPYPMQHTHDATAASSSRRSTEAPVRVPAPPEPPQRCTTARAVDLPDGGRYLEGGDNLGIMQILHYPQVILMLIHKWACLCG